MPRSGEATSSTASRQRAEIIGALLTTTRNHPLSPGHLDTVFMGPGIIRLLRLARRLHGAWAVVAAVVMASALFPQQALAQDTGTARAQAVVLTPGSVAKTADMDFGKIAQANTPGTIVLSPQDSATCAITGGLIRSGTCRAARFSIMGRRNNRVRIRQNNGGQVTLNGPNGATMSVNNLTIGINGMTSINGGNGWDFGNYRIDTNSGITEFWIGGTLNVGAAQEPGVYSGTLIIQIQFN